MWAGLAIKKDQTISIFYRKKSDLFIWLVASLSQYVQWTILTLLYVAVWKIPLTWKGLKYIYKGHYLQTWHTDPLYPVLSQSQKKLCQSWVHRPPCSHGFGVQRSLILQAPMVTIRFSEFGISSRSTGTAPTSIFLIQPLKPESKVEPPVISKYV